MDKEKCSLKKFLHYNLNHLFISILSHMIKVINLGGIEHWKYLLESLHCNFHGENFFLRNHGENLNPWLGYISHLCSFLFAVKLLV